MSEQNPFTGGLLPTAEEVTTYELPVTGHLPAALNGRYLRNGPNPMDLEDPRLHLFLGEGMVHGVRLRDGRAEWYRNRWVRSDDVAAALGEAPRGGATVNLADFASNTHVIGHAGRTLALVEAGLRPYELSYELDTVGRCDFGGTLPGGYTAHPKRDPETGELHAVTYQVGDEQVHYVVVSPDGRVRRTVDIPAPHFPVMHDFALTGKYAVLYDLPVTFSPAAAEAGVPLPQAWDGQRPARLGLLPRDGTQVERWFEIDPCWIFHTLNAYDDGDTVVIDAVRYESMLRDARLDGHPLPTLERWTLDTVTGKATQSRLDDRPQELPTVNPEVTGAAHRYGYTAVPTDLLGYVGPEQRQLPDEALSDSLLKHDLTGGGVQERRFPRGAYVGEPYFVPAGPPGMATAEDDGYVLAFAHDPERGASDLLVLSAQDFTGPPVAAVHLPVRVPLGFHGSWVPDTK